MAPADSHRQSLSRTEPDESADLGLRDSGIRGIGEMAWGTHACMFYETKADLLDAAANAASIGVPVYTVVLGKTSGPGAADAGLLSQIASATGATTSTAGSAEALTTIYQDLGSELSTQLQISSSAQLFVIIAVLLAMAAAVVVIVLSQRRPS